MIVRQTLLNMSNFETSKLTCTNLPQQSLPLDARDEDFKLVMVSNVSVHSGRKVGVRKSQTSSSWSGRMATRDEITWATTNSSNLLLLLSYVTCSVLLDAEEPATKTGAYESLGDHVESARGTAQRCKPSLLPSPLQSLGLQPVLVFIK